MLFKKSFSMDKIAKVAIAGCSSPYLFYWNNTTRVTNDLSVIRRIDYLPIRIFKSIISQQLKERRYGRLNIRIVIFLNNKKIVDGHFEGSDPSKNSITVTELPF